MNRCHLPHRTINLREKVGLREISFHLSGQMEAVMGISEGYCPWYVLPSVMGTSIGHHHWCVLPSVMGTSVGHHPWCVLPCFMGICSGHRPWCMLPSVMGISAGHHFWCVLLGAMDTIPGVLAPGKAELIQALFQAVTDYRT